MNKPAVIEQFKRAESEDVPLGKNKYIADGAYCSLGLIGHYNGVTNEELRILLESAPFDDYEAARYHFLRVIQIDFEIGDEEWTDLVAFNDHKAATWADLIEYVEKQNGN